MPIYRVTIEERHNDYVEEIYHAVREMFCTRVYEVEAEDEQEAQELAEQEEGTLVDEDWDYGDIINSEYHETGESIDSEWQGQDVTIETMDEYSERYREEIRRREDQMRIARENHARWLRERELKRMAREIGEKPTWEL